MPERYRLRRMLSPVPVTICDVGPSDGLQAEPKQLDPATRAEADIYFEDFAAFAGALA